MNRTFAVGDIHGHLALLDALLPRLKERAQPGDTLLFLGDYIDRGPDSPGVVDRVLELQAGAWNGPVVTLRGNHDDWLLDCLRDKSEYPDHRDWLDCGGSTTLTNYYDLHGITQMRGVRDLPQLLPAAHLAFFEATLYRYEDDHAHYVHAGFEPGFPIEQQSTYTMLWIRDPFLLRPYNWGRPVVFGHTPQFEGMFKGPGPATNWQPLNQPEKIGIDLGVCYGGHLCAVQMPEREFIIVEREQA